MGEIDRLQTFVAKKNKVWIWTALAHFRSGILGLVVGEPSAKTFIILLQAITEAKLHFFLRNAAQICRVAKRLLAVLLLGKRGLAINN